MDNQCHLCGKCFDRKDTLRRHVHIHDHDRPRPKSKKRACIQCVRSKIKCLGEQPICSTCSKRQLDCVYNSSSTSELPVTASFFTPEPSSNLADLLPQSASYNSISNNVLGNEEFMFGDINITSQMDWVFFNSFDHVFPDLNPNALQAGSDAGVSESRVQEPIQSSPVGSILEHPQPVSDVLGGSEDRWPKDWRGVPAQLSSLPILCDSYQIPAPSYFPSTVAISDSALTSIQDYLQASLKTSPWQPVSLESLPGKETLDHFIDLFFIHFDKFYPILHRPSFDAAKDPFLTLSIAAIGACYSGFKAARAFATSLSELTRRLLLFMAEYDPRFVRTESYIAAQLLQSVHGFSSGSKRLYELSDSNRSSIISHARSLKLFEQPQFTENSGKETDVQLRWEAWLRVEKSRRLAWAICTFDASATYFHNARPLLSMIELKMDLPGSIAHWQAETAQAWAALHPWTTMPPASSLGSVLESVSRAASSYDEMPDANHSQIVANLFARSIWDLRESALEPSALFAPVDTRDLRSRRMQAIAASLQRLTVPLIPSSRDLISHEFELLVQRTYIVHAGILLTAEDALDHMHLVWAKLGSRSQEARTHLLEWGSRCPSQVRMVTHRAAQILSIARKYPYNHPNEPYHVFHGGFILWTMLGILMESSVEQRSNGSIRNRLCRIDWQGDQDAPEALSVRDWVDNGGHDYTVGMDSIPDLVSEKGMRQVLELAADTLKRLRVWGIAETFLNAVLRVLHD